MEKKHIVIGTLIIVTLVFAVIFFNGELKKKIEPATGGSTGGGGGGSTGGSTGGAADSGIVEAVDDSHVEVENPSTLPNSNVQRAKKTPSLPNYHDTGKAVYPNQ